MKRQKDKTFAFRIASGDLDRMKGKARKAKMTMTDYLTSCALGKEIVVIQGLEPLISEMKAQGRNLNQMTMLAHCNQLDPQRLDCLISKYGDFCEVLECLTRKVK